jgi:phosphopantothenoylcysteine decarboxylase/phosphopantothenate--cysteine ligase
MSASDRPVPAASDLAGYEVVVGVTGGIAAYKTCAVVSALVQRGAGVTCVMTRAARRFVRPLTFEALSGRKVLTSLWRPDLSYDPQHIHLSQRTDLFVVAPATANIIAKVAHGLADDLLSTLAVSMTCPMLMAPSMNAAMWSNRVVAANVRKLAELDVRIVGPGTGWQACRTVGTGRMEEPERIVAAIAELLLSDSPRSKTGEGVSPSS